MFPKLVNYTNLAKFNTDLGLQIIVNKQTVTNYINYVNEQIVIYKLFRSGDTSFTNISKNQVKIYYNQEMSDINIYNNQFKQLDKAFQNSEILF